MSSSIVAPYHKVLGKIHGYRKRVIKTKAEKNEEAINRFKQRVEDYQIRSDGIATHVSDSNPEIIVHPHNENIVQNDKYTLVYAPIQTLVFKIYKFGAKRTVKWADGVVRVQEDHEFDTGVGKREDVFTLCRYCGIETLDELRGHRVPIIIVWDEYGESIDTIMYELGRVERELRKQKEPQADIIGDMETAQLHNKEASIINRL